MKRKNEVLVGILLTVALAVGILGTIWLVRGGFQQGYPLYAIFRWGENLKVGQPVRLAGVQVGYVGDVQLRDDGTLYVIMKIDDGRKVPSNATAIVEPVGIFGDAQVALRATPSAQSYAEGDTVPPGQAPPGIAGLTAKADSVLAVTVNVSRSLETQLIKEGGIDDVRRTLALTADLTARLNRVAEEQSRELTLTQRRLRGTLAAVDSAAVDSTVRSLRDATANLSRLSSDFQTTSLRINSILAKVDSGGGTAAMLINDPGLYNDLRRLTTRLDSLTSDFKKNPRRYINLEIF
jgi:phospholipid/cholesterol/gamma-HCH transport system substrate-binding protein